MINFSIYYFEFEKYSLVPRLAWKLNIMYLHGTH